MSPRLVPLLLPAALALVIVWALLEHVDQRLQETTTVLLLAVAGGLVLAHVAVILSRR